MNAELDKQRLLELLADQALFGLNSEEQAELAALQPRFPEIEAQEMDRIVALLESSSPAPNVDEMPASVKQRIRDSSRQMASDGTGKETIKREVLSESSPSSRGRRDLLIAVLASAAALLFASLLNWRPELTTAEQRNALLANATDLVQVDWSPTDAANEYSGDVVWSDSEQKGFMTFRGLPINDPDAEQYQLWIFDSVQNTDTPIDGGVFDVSSGEVVVPIDAKIQVVDPAMFAITLERPGGVVVSLRKRLPLIAKVAGE